MIVAIAVASSSCLRVVSPRRLTILLALRRPRRHHLAFFGLRRTALISLSCALIGRLYRSLGRVDSLGFEVACFFLVGAHFFKNYRREPPLLAVFKILIILA